MDRTPQEMGEEFEGLLGLHCANVAKASIAAAAERLKTGRSEECEASYSVLMQAFNSLTARLSAAEAKLAEVEADARRYRWLRDVGDVTWRPFSLREGCFAALVDAAIDQAMKEGGTK